MSRLCIDRQLDLGDENLRQQVLDFLEELGEETTVFTVTSSFKKGGQRNLSEQNGSWAKASSWPGLQLTTASSPPKWASGAGLSKKSVVSAVFFLLFNPLSHYRLHRLLDHFHGLLLRSRLETQLVYSRIHRPLWCCTWAGSDAGHGAEAHGAHGGGHHGVDGKTLPLFWGLPFIGILLSIALFPLAMEHFWHHNYGKIALFWAILFVVPFYAYYGSDAIYEYAHHASGLRTIYHLLATLFCRSWGYLCQRNAEGLARSQHSHPRLRSVTGQFYGNDGRRHAC